MKKLHAQISKLCVKLSFVPPLLARICIGYVFMPAGWGKLHNLDKIIAYFTELGIPAPQIQAPFVSLVEFLGGLAMLLGFGVRYVSVLLMSVMGVALITAKKEAFESFSTLLDTSEFLYLIILLMIFHAGAGKISVDRYLEKRK